MSDPPNYDQDLLSRLNALRKTNISLHATPNPSVNVSQQEETTEIGLSERLRSLGNGVFSKPSTPAPSNQTSHSQLAEETHSPSLKDDIDPFFESSNENDDRTLDELLAEIGPEAQWLNPDDSDDVEKLMNEAKDALRNKDTPEPSSEDHQEQEKRDANNILTSGLDMSVFQLDDESEEKERKEHQDLEKESREVQDIIAKLLDEVNLESNEPENVGDHDVPKEEVQVSGYDPAMDDDDPSVMLPSVPSKIPDPPPQSAAPSRKSLDFESDIIARLAALKGLGSSSSNPLGLPSAPTAKPVAKSAGPATKGLKKYTDDEIDAWCIICQDDATVECTGCEGDLYCARCWKEGHVGSDAGYEFKRHQWKKYQKPG